MSVRICRAPGERGLCKPPTGSRIEAELRPVLKTSLVGPNSPFTLLKERSS